MKDFRILIIEDEKQMSQLLEMELAHEGYNVDTAFDGISGLNKIETERYDLILLDIMLPDWTVSRFAEGLELFPTCLSSCLQRKAMFMTKLQA